MTTRTHTTWFTTLVNYPDGGPANAGRAAANSPVREEPLVIDALELLAERFISASHDGPSAYSNFLTGADDLDSKERLRNEAVAAVKQFLAAAGSR